MENKELNVEECVKEPVLSKEVKARLQKMIEKEAVLVGTPRMTEFNQELNSDVIMIEVLGEPVLIPRDELEANESNGIHLGKYLGMELKFNLKEIREDGLIIGTSKEIRKRELTELVEKLKRGESTKAQITRIMDFGAFVDIEGFPALIRNQDFSEDYATLADVHKKGDFIEVVLNHVTSGGRLYLNPKSKHETKSKIGLDTLTPQQIVLGSVRAIKTWGAFVRIAPGVDALCNIPEGDDIQVGSKVVFSITQVHPEKEKLDEDGNVVLDDAGNPVLVRSKVRGKILRVQPTMKEMAS